MNYRHEWKHELNELDLLTLRSRLRALMEPDHDRRLGRGPACGTDGCDRL